MHCCWLPISFESQHFHIHVHVTLENPQKCADYTQTTLSFIDTDNTVYKLSLCLLRTVDVYACI